MMEVSNELFKRIAKRIKENNHWFPLFLFYQFGVRPTEIKTIVTFEGGHEIEMTTAMGETTDFLEAYREFERRQLIADVEEHLLNLR